MNKVSRIKCEEWLLHPNAFFFRYDDNYVWHDATEEFRTFAMKKLSTPVIHPKITKVAPPETHAGVNFNAQPDGTSAIGIEGLYFDGDVEVLINGQKRPTIVGRTFVSATIPPAAYARPGNISVQVRN